MGHMKQVDVSLGCGNSNTSRLPRKPAYPRRRISPRQRDDRWILPVVNLCEEMLNSMQRGKTEGVHQKTLNRLVRFIDQFKAMNFADDREMEQRLEQVRGEFLDRSAGDYRDSPAAQRDLEQGLAAMRDHANELLEQDAKELVERFGQMGRRKLQLAG